MLIRHAGAVLAMLALVGCSGPPAAPAPTAPVISEPLKVVTSTNVYGSIAQAIGGDAVTVSAVIADPGIDPGSYRATPTDAARMADADVVVINGGGYDDWMHALLGATVRRTPRVIEVTELSGLRPLSGAGNDGFDPHLWYHLPTMRRFASRLATELGAADPVHAPDFTTRSETFNAMVTDLLAEVEAIETAHGGSAVLVDDTLPGYLLDAAGLTDATPPMVAGVIEATNVDRGPPQPFLRAALDDAFRTRIEAVVLNTQTDTPTRDTISEAAQVAGVPVVNLTETLPPDTDYIAWVNADLDALSAALRAA